MARTVLKISVSDSKSVNERICMLLTQRGYKNIYENNENVWKCGSGFWTAMKYIKIEYSEDNTLILSGWIRPALGNEQDLTGFVAALPKKQVINVLSEIQRLAE